MLYIEVMCCILKYCTCKCVARVVVLRSIVQREDYKRTTIDDANTMLPHKLYANWCY